MAADLQAIAIEQRWCRSCPSGKLPTACPIPCLGGPVRSARGGWCELGHKTCVCGNLHKTSATGRQCPHTTTDLRRLVGGYVADGRRLEALARLLVPFGPSAAPGLPFSQQHRAHPLTGDYLWHCHILDHEDNDMMLPYKVTL
jgi:mRNA-degrading endonuclease YafQ of YafQ-DinJ toxin-antitoxin module